MTALIVPVASTTSSMSPRSTFAVKCCTDPARFRPNAANRAITAAKPARINHLFLVFIQFSSGGHPQSSFVSQSFDGIEQRRFARRVIPEKHAHRYGKERRHRYRFEGHLRLPMQGLPHQVRSEDSKEHARGAAHEAEHNRFAQELKLDSFFRSSHRHAHSDL